MKRKISEVFINGKKFYRALISPKGAKPKFITKKSKAEIEKYLSIKYDFIKRDATGAVASIYSVEQLADIKRAMEMLPAGFTLVDAVKQLKQYQSDKTLPEAIAQYLDTKTNRNLDDDYTTHLKGRLHLFAEHFDTFDKATPEAIVEWLYGLKRRNGESLAPKTIKHYKDAVDNFFAFCQRKDFIINNPMDKLTSDDLPAIDSPPPEILTIEQTQSFMAMLLADFPQFVKFYAIAMFAGVRIAEIERLTNNNIDIANKRLYLPHKIQKTDRADVLEDIEPNIWEWLKKTKKAPIIRPSNKMRTNLQREVGFILPHNFARHSFATYHYSLYLDKRRTCAITRHSEAMLLRHYLALRVEKEVARAYFDIAP